MMMLLRAFFFFTPSRHHHPFFPLSSSFSRDFSSEIVHAKYKKGVKTKIRIRDITFHQGSPHSRRQCIIEKSEDDDEGDDDDDDAAEEDDDDNDDDEDTDDDMKGEVRSSTEEGDGKECDGRQEGAGGEK